MTKDVLIKNENGSYVFSSYGESLTYYHTMRQLLGHYMQKGLMLPPEKIQVKIETLKGFLETNFQKLDDYLEKMQLISQYIGESNESRFSAFIGKNFMSSLERIKAQLYQKEIPRAKHKFENPYRTISDDLLEAYGALFQKSAPLKLNGGKAEASDQPSANEQTSEINQTQKIDNLSPQNAVPETAAAESAAEYHAVDYSYVPGEKLLENYGGLFQQAKPLAVLKAAVEEKPSEMTQEQPKEAPLVFEEKKEAGIRLLEKYMTSFQQAPPLKIKSFTEVSSQEHAPQIPRQTLFKNYVSLLSMVSKYTRANDKEGYQKWYASLAPLHKTVLSLNNLQKREERGENINWNDIVSKMSGQFKVPLDKIQKIKYENQSYAIILKEIQQTLRKFQPQGLDPSISQALYGQLINLFENKDSYNIKKSELKIILLQISNAQIREPIETAFFELLTKAKEMYPLP
ncbi:MAG: hypothetical protein OEZ13_06005 [Spirochaetia bacterium]|nr:hypothetical protein [Spirochaetia bacterium]